MQSNDPRLIQRMSDMAQSYEDGAARLAQSGADYGPSSHVLSILAFEILLKAVYRLEKNEAPCFGHKYAKGYKALGQPLQQRLAEIAAERICTPNLDLQSALAICCDLEKVFTKARYGFEGFEELGPEEYTRSGMLWAECGFRDDDAEYRFWPEERYGLCFAFRCHIVECLKQSLSSRE